MSYELLKEYCAEHEVEIRFDEVMARHTYLKIGGAVDIALFPDEATLQGIVKLLVCSGIPYVVIGGGTNILVRDGGLEGAAIFTGRMNNIVRQNEEHIFVQSGCSLQKVISLCSEEGLAGMEGMAGIPGSVGGAISGNAGSFGYEIKDVVTLADLLMADGSVKSSPGKDLGFGYRKSALPAGSIVLGANMSLKKDDPVDVKKRTGEFREMKKAAQPLSEHSAGCVFKNAEGDPAGRLIDEAGCKGLRVGGIEVSRQHANFFINTGKGSASDYLRLLDLVSGKVREKFGIILEPEIKIIGKN